jgi:hypothetical protein
MITYVCIFTEFILAYVFRQFDAYLNITKILFYLILNIPSFKETIVSINKRKSVVAVGF